MAPIVRQMPIALALGFSGGANFATAFKERFGLSPRDFRAGKGAH
jgi:AraC-like DNA-binding protein